MAPNNAYLSADESVQQRLSARGLVKRTTVEGGVDFTGDPEIHVDFNKSVEADLLAPFLDQFAEPDFVDGKVTLEAAAQAVYGPDFDEYLTNRLSTTMLRPWSPFNKTHGKDGLVFVASADGHIARGDPDVLSEQELIARLQVEQERAEKEARGRATRIRAAHKKASQIAPKNAAKLEAIMVEKVAEILQGAVGADAN
jgi:hypothetical protein